MGMTETIKVDNDLWEIIAFYHENLHNNTEHIQCRFKQFRSLLLNAESELNTSILELLSNCAEKLIQCEGITSTDLYAAKSLFISTYEKMKAHYVDTDSVPPSLEKLRTLSQQL